MALRIAFIGLKGLPSTWTGVEFHVDRLGRGLVARGHEVTAYTRTHYTPPGLVDHEGIRLVTLPTIRSKHLDASVHSLLSSVHAMRRPYDIVHYHCIGPGFFGVLPRLAGQRIVCTVHRLDWEADKWGRLGRTFLHLAEAVSVRAAHRTIAVSAEVQAHLNATHGCDAVLIPNGWDAATPRTAGRIRERYGLNGGDYVLFMGRLSPEKRVDWLIQAFRALPRPAVGGRALTLVVAGGSNATDAYAAGLRALAHGDSRVVFTGFVEGEEKAELLSNAYVFALPSRIEGLPIVLFEAMAYGACCLASDIPAHREILHHGQDSLLFDASSQADLAATLQALIDAPERVPVLGAQARARMVSRIGWDEVVARTEAVYQSVARRPR